MLLMLSAFAAQVFLLFYLNSGQKNPMRCEGRKHKQLYKIRFNYYETFVLREEKVNKKYGL